MPQDHKLPKEPSTQDFSSTPGRPNSNSSRVRTQSLSSLNTSAVRFARSAQTDEGLANTTSDIFQYIEQSRLALETQRIAFEREQAAFAAQRRLWERERVIMSKRISDLEDQVCQATRGTGTATSTGESSPAQPTRPKGSRDWKQANPTADPVREFPSELKRSRSGSKTKDQFDPQTVPCLDDALSPRSQPADKSPHMSIPVELIDGSLDGITLKSTGLPAGAIARMSPPSRSKYISSLQQPIPKTNEPELSPSLASTPRHADGGLDHSTTGSTSHSTPSERFQIPDAVGDEQPLAPQQTREQVETSNSSFSELDDDPALQGPLSLQNDAAVDDQFLRELDQKLSKEAQNPVSGSSTGPEDVSDTEEKPETEPELRFRGATNFGTAFGSSQCEGR